MLHSCRNQSSDLQKKSVYRFLYAWGTGLEYDKEIVGNWNCAFKRKKKLKSLLC